MWGLVFVALFLTLAPAIAAYAKLSFIQLLADRTPLADAAGVDLHLRQAGACRGVRPGSDRRGNRRTGVRGAARREPCAASARRFAQPRHDRARRCRTSPGSITPRSGSSPRSPLPLPWRRRMARLSAIIRALGFDTDVTARRRSRRAARGSPPMQSPRSSSLPQRLGCSVAAGEHPR